MSDTIETGDKIVEMPGSTHRRTWLVTAVDGDVAVLKLVDKAVGYVTSEETRQFDRETLSDAVEDGVLTGDIVKTAPDWDEELVP